MGEGEGGGEEGELDLWRVGFGLGLIVFGGGVCL